MSAMGEDKTLELSGRTLDTDADCPVLTSSTNEGIDTNLSNVKLVVLGSAFFAIWAGNASATLMSSFVLPVIAQEFGASASQVQWVLASSTIGSGSLQIIAGRCCDMYGRKRAFHCSMISWIVPNILSAFMPNLASLNACRGIAGIGAAIALPAAAGMIGTSYPAGRKRTLAFVTVTCGGVSGASGGMLIAGAFLEYNRWTWRPCYLLIGLVYLWPWAIVTWLVPSDPPHIKRSKLAWLGSILMGLSLFLLLFGFTSSQTETRGWKTPYVPVLIAASGVLMACFVLRQAQLTRAMAKGPGARASPLIPRSLLSSDCWDLLVLYAAAACAWGATDTFWVLISYLYLDVLKIGALQAGLRLSVVLFSGLAAALAVGLTIDKIPPRAFIAGFSTVSVASFVIMAVRRLDWPYGKADLWALLFVAYNTDVLVAAGQTLVSMTAPIKDGSIAVALFQTSCKIGAAIGLAVATLIQTNVEAKAVREGTLARDALVEGLRAAFWYCGAVAAVAALLVLVCMRGWPKMSDMKQGEESSDEDTSPAVPSGNTVSA